MPHNPLLSSRARKRALVFGGAVAALVLVSAGTAAADPLGWWASQPHPFNVKSDFGSVGRPGSAVTGNVLSNDQGATAVVRHGALSDPSAGSLTVNTDGSYSFVPAKGKHGTVSFGYTATDAITLYKDAVPGGDKIPPLGTLEGPNGSTVSISGGGYGSSFTAAPGKPAGWFYGVTDRGPNADDDGPLGDKVFVDPTFTPQIGLFQLVNGQAVLQQTITLKAPNGTPYNGLPNPVTKVAASSETAEDLYGNIIDPTKPYTVPTPGSASTTSSASTNSAVTPDSRSKPKPKPTSTPTPAPTTLNPDNGYDSEGLVALPDGTFWVSDEYGPFITHFDHNGKEIERLSPWGADAGHNVDTKTPLPAELQLRTKNKGMEGLTVTPDGKTLVGIMQSALTVPDYGKSAITGKTVKSANVAPVRIVTVDLRTKQTHEYLYLLDDPATTGNAVSEITALSSTKFVVDERDGNQQEPGKAAIKDLYEIDLSGATDVKSSSNNPIGYTIGGKSIDAYVGDAPTGQAEQLLAQAGVVPVSKTPYVEVGTVLNQLDPSGALFPHDKIEGVAATDGGKTLYLSNDSDFGMDHLLGTDEAACEASGLSDTTACAPVKDPTTGAYLVHQKTLDASGVVDDGEVLKVDVSKLPAVLGSATVTIRY